MGTSRAKPTAAAAAGSKPSTRTLLRSAPTRLLARSFRSSKLESRNNVTVNDSKLAEAMNNPNWRRQSSIPKAASGKDITKKPCLEVDKSSECATPPPLSSVNNKVELKDGIDSNSKSRMSTSLLEYSASLNANKTPFQIIKQVELPPVLPGRERSHVIQVTLASNKHLIADKSKHQFWITDNCKVQICPVNTNYSSHNGISTPPKRLISEVFEGNIKSPNPNLDSPSLIQRKTKALEISDIKQEETPLQYYATKAQATTASPIPDNLPSYRRSMVQDSYPRERKTLQSREKAFRKLLLKLQSSALKSTDQEMSANNTSDEDPAPTVEFRKPISGLGRRLGVMSDDVLSYDKYKKKVSDCRDVSSYSSSSNSSSKFNTLNPKAREFLSFTKAQEPNQGQGQATISRKPLPDFDAWKPPSNAIPLYSGTSTGLNEAKSQPPQSPPPPTFVRPPYESLESATILPPYAILPPLPHVTSLQHMIPVPKQPPMMIPVPNIPSGFPMNSSLQLPGQFYTFPRSLHHSVQKHPLLPSFFPIPNALNAPNIPPPLVMPVVQPMGGAPNPYPVQKPRIPNTSDQQAYEAWIEWRRANEPGYAIECRMRQQRRSRKYRGSMQNTRMAPGATTVVAV